ncbi:hypothetical protein GGD92_18405 [Pseudomonas protegens]|uniref:Short-chain dehydrogenase n=1 Tax=Pseudomonas protegens TaxID=380021 RepID=A0A7G7XJI0_9PSED|nr:hypothetical protein [Pseudomonas protegens]QNH80125.1 hypothetical protein GGI48_13480 [Pseudomonas protegens]QNL03552.1 hypothetical protein GGD92_18405 [Pseudomonas protegens]
MNAMNLDRTRYQPLKSNFTNTATLVIDTQADALDLHSCARQRLRAASDLLETLTCLSFDQADSKDTTHVVNALYLLVQDGCDLLEHAHLRMP